MAALIAGTVAAPMTRACEALGISRATAHRKRHPSATVRAESSVTETSPKRRSPRALDETDRQRIVNALHSPEFVDQTPREVFACLLSMGIYLASVRTMYRVLASLGEATDRRRGHEHKRHAVPQLEAFAPNEVWAWDITKVPSFATGVFVTGTWTPSPPADQRGPRSCAWKSARSGRSGFGSGARAVRVQRTTAAGRGSRGRRWGTG